MDAAKSSVTATGKQLGVPMDIKFGKFDAAVSYNPANLAASTAKVDIDVSSVDVGDKAYNDELKKKDWFDAAKYRRRPSCRPRSSRVPAARWKWSAS